MAVESNNLIDFDFLIEEVDIGSVVRYQLLVGNQPISFRAFIHGLYSETIFRQRFNKLLMDAPYNSYRFETPALSSNSIDNAFEFVLIDAPGLCRSTVDSLTFAEHFDGVAAGQHKGIVEFKSLGGDATLIAPMPVSSKESYKHLASFVRNAPESQVDALWQLTGEVLMRDAGEAPLWLNTEGSGVAWLHVRIDSRPKYYGFRDYKVVNGGKKSESLL